MQPVDSTREGSDGWRLRARTPGGAGRRPFTSYCGRSNPLLTTASSAPTLVAKDESASIAGRVRGGAGGGGWRLRVAGRADLPHCLKAHGIGHVGGVRGEQQPGPPALHRHRLLRFVPAGPQERTKSRTADGNVEKFNQTVAAGCPANRRLRSGGFEIDYNVVEPAENSDLGLVHASRRSGDEWRLTAFAFLGHPEMTAFAYCD